MTRLRANIEDSDDLFIDDEVPCNDKSTLLGDRSSKQETKRRKRSAKFRKKLGRIGNNIGLGFFHFLPLFDVNNFQEVARKTAIALLSSSKQIWMHY
ncbi:hypothetical protein TrispH2_011764 [Trichoplax sp. H2]|nr:hypothetical protein TrispH2_011764 [Trichoplax sp. H2]|eukprot:RDD36583.1 hypothetical protein TrispH2_011764 [Trichoplax sp. H2]